MRLIGLAKLQFDVASPVGVGVLQKQVQLRGAGLPPFVVAQHKAAKDKDLGL